MQLIITNKYDITVDMVVSELRRRNVNFFRFNTEDFPLKTQCEIELGTNQLPKVHFDLGHNRKFWLSDVKSIYYRRPKPFEISAEIQLPEAKRFALQECQATIHGIWMVIDCLWINHPRQIKNAEFKINQLPIATTLGFEIPKTLITNNPDKVREFYDICNGNIIAKVLNIGAIEYKDKALLIYANRLSPSEYNLIDTVKYAPCCFQEYISKQVEIRVTVVGDRIFAAEIHSQNSERTKDDWRRYDFEKTLYLPHTLPRNIEQQCIQIVKYFGLVFGAIDLILTPEGKYIFLELNPNGQWGWIEELTDLPICSAIVDLLTETKN